MLCKLCTKRDQGLGWMHLFSVMSSFLCRCGFPSAKNTLVVWAVQVLLSRPFPMLHMFHQRQRKSWSMCRDIQVTMHRVNLLKLLWKHLRMVSSTPNAFIFTSTPKLPYRTTQRICFFLSPGTAVSMLSIQKGNLPPITNLIFSLLVTGCSWIVIAFCEHIVICLSVWSV